MAGERKQITQDSEPNTLPTELFQPTLSPTLPKKKKKKKGMKSHYNIFKTKVNTPRKIRSIHQKKKRTDNKRWK